MFVPYSMSATTGNSQSTKQSYNSPTQVMYRWFRLKTRATSNGFTTRLSRNRISAVVRPRPSATGFHSSPPKTRTKSFFVCFCFVYQLIINSYCISKPKFHTSMYTVIFFVVLYCTKYVSLSHGHALVNTTNEKA